VRIAVYCPPGTANVRLDLRNAGRGTLALESPALTVMSPSP
jgi:hypothetical protein